MGYTLEFYAGSLDAVRAELVAPRLAPPADAQDVRQDWPRLAAEVAALSGPGGDVTGPHAAYVRHVVRAVGAFYGAVPHTSSGGRWFRSEFLAGSVADLFGEDVAVHLVNRPIDGLTWPDLPMLGWLSLGELRRLAGREPGPEDAETDVDALWTVVDIVDRAAATGQDLVTVYC